MDQATMSYACDGCTDTIPDHKARIHCTTCPNYDLCTNCYALGISTQTHSVTHDVSVFPQSITSGPPALPPRAKASTALASPATTASSGRMRAQGGWQPLFSGSSPTSTFVAFLTAVFTQIDADRDGLITPEEYTSFLEVQNYTNAEHVWKRFHVAQWVYTADDCADYELTTIFENFSIAHTAKRRPGANTVASGRSFSNDMMPMLSLEGFIDISVVETLSEPAPGWKRVNQIARHYSVFREWGDCPRSMMPQNPPGDLMERIGRCTRLTERRNRERVHANARRLNADLANQEACLRMLDPPGTRYYYTR